MCWPLALVAPLLSSESSSARRFSGIVSDEDWEVAAALLCARFLFPSSPSSRACGHLSRGHPVRGTRARGRACGGAAAAGGWVQGRGTDRASSGLWRSLLHHPDSLFRAPPPPLRLPRAYWVAGVVRARLASHPQRVLCAPREGPPTVTWSQSVS